MSIFLYPEDLMLKIISFLDYQSSINLRLTKNKSHDDHEIKILRELDRVKKCIVIDDFYPKTLVLPSLAQTIIMQRLPTSDLTHRYVYFSHSISSHIYQKLASKQYIFTSLMQLQHKRRLGHPFILIGIDRTFIIMTENHQTSFFQIQKNPIKKSRTNIVGVVPIHHWESLTDLTRKLAYILQYKL